MKRFALILAVLAALFSLYLVSVGASHGIDRLRNPWAYAQPPLVGSWQGDARAGGMRLRITLTLIRDAFNLSDLDETEDSHRSLHGTAMLCDSTGRRQLYQIEGLVHDRRARITSLTFLDPPKPAPGLRPSSFRFTWDGGPQLEAKTQLGRALADGSIETASDDDLTNHEIPFELHPVSTQTCTIP